MQWGNVETTKGTYSFSAYDSTISAFQAAGITPVIILDYGNVLYQTGPNTYKTFPTTSAAITGFANYAAATASHYGTGVIYEIYNEENQNPPDGVSTGAAVAPYYVALLTPALRAIINAVPTARVLTGGAGTTDPIGFITAVLSNMTASDLNSLTGISLHPYNSYDFYHTSTEWSDVNLYNPFKVAVSSSYASVSGANRAPPIYNTEEGLSVSWINGYSLTRHGLAVARELLDSVIDGAAIHVQYSSQDQGSDPSLVENLFGLYDVNGNVKPALTAYAAASSALQGFSTYGVYQNTTTGVYDIRLKKTNGVSRDIVWTSAATFLMTIPGSYSTGTDLYGNTVAITSNGSTTTIPLTEAGGPVVLN